MPFTPDEKKEIDRLERRIDALQRDLLELTSERTRDRDERLHEWRTMLESAKTLLTKAVADQVSGIKDVRPLLDDLHAELLAARGRAVAHEKEAAVATALKDAEDLRRKRAAEDAAADAVKVASALQLKEAERSHRRWFWGVVLGILTILAGLAGATINSHYRPVSTERNQSP